MKSLWLPLCCAFAFAWLLKSCTTTVGVVAGFQQSLGGDDHRRSFIGRRQDRASRQDGPFSSTRPLLPPRDRSEPRVAPPPGLVSSPTALMGIPKMFRWLTDLYPDILNKELEEGLSADLNVDNFYLDMNGTNLSTAAITLVCRGTPSHMLALLFTHLLCVADGGSQMPSGIIHPATHGNAEGEIIVLDETAMFRKIFLYVDR
jgi:hypothetical protein